MVFVGTGVSVAGDVGVSCGASVVFVGTGVSVAEDVGVSCGASVAVASIVLVASLPLGGVGGCATTVAVAIG